VSDSSRLPRHILRLADPGQRQATRFELLPDAADRAAIAAYLGILGVQKLRFAGLLRPEGRKDWRLEGDLGATVVQESVVSLEEVATRIDERVERRYLADPGEPEADEAEMPEDDTIEALPQSLDLVEVMTEALALALPPYPRAEGEELGEVVVTETGAEPLTEERAKPFSALRDAFKPKD
jgi:uncharacterized metal-binding protein YceD (DUF177 family)